MKIEINNKPKHIPMKDMPYEVFAVIVETGYEGVIVFRPYKSDGNHFIALSQKDGIDGYSKDCPIKVRVLEKGESFTVTI